MGIQEQLKEKFVEFEQTEGVQKAEKTCSTAWHVFCYIWLVIASFLVVWGVFGKDFSEAVYGGILFAIAAEYKWHLGCRGVITFLKFFFKGVRENINFRKAIF